MQNRVELTMAISPYDHVRDVTLGHVPVEGVSLTVLEMPVEEIFFRFTAYREWDVTELSFAKFVALISRGDMDIVGIPVFPSRVFRHSSIYARDGSGILEPTDLRGRRVGIPEWVQTAGVYVRGLLSHEYAVEAKEIEWFQTGVMEPGREEQFEIAIPGVSLTKVNDRSLSDMLERSQLDAVISAKPPRQFQTGEVYRLFREGTSVEREYFERTGIFPIMHVIAIRRPVYERWPWVAMSLFKALLEARERSVGRLLDASVSMFPLPFGHLHALAEIDSFGHALFPYGVEENRTTLEAFLLFAREQQISVRALVPEDLFAKETLAAFRV